MAKTLGTMEKAMVEAIKAETVFDRMPPWIVDTLTPEQKEAVYLAIRPPEWKFHPINIRISIPLIGRRYYLTLVGGEDGRSAARRQHDRHRYPLRTAANLLFITALGVGLGMLALASSFFRF
jgi:hypothetical protein